MIRTNRLSAVPLFCATFLPTWPRDLKQFITNTEKRANRLLVAPFTLHSHYTVILFFLQVNLPLHIGHADARTAGYQLLLISQVVEYLEVVQVFLSQVPFDDIEIF